MKKKMILAVIGAFFVLGLSGCSSEPTYYSKKEVKRYVKDVFSEKCKLKEEKSYPDDTDEGNPIYEYVFETKNGMSFSVYSSTRHPYVAASETKFYEKQIDDNYIDSVMVSYLDEIKKVCQAASFDQAVTTYDRDTGMGVSIELYLDNYKQIDEAAQIICNIDELISFEYDYRKYCEENPLKSITVYLKPDHYEEIDNWEPGWDSRIDDVDLSCAKNMRLDKAEVVDFLEYQLAAKIRNGSTCYSIPDEVLNQYSDD